MNTLIKKNLVLDFNHFYENDKENFDPSIEYIDMSDICGTDMYCTAEAQQEISNRLSGYSANGIHFLGSGDYHYVSEFFVNKITEPFNLVLFDYHNDMQLPMIHDLTSCGGWAGDILNNNKLINQLIIIGPDQKTINAIESDNMNKLVCISLQTLEKHKAKNEVNKIDTNKPVYISIDKDVLSKTYARTNWNQGEMSLSVLEHILKSILTKSRVIGVDICGEYARDISYWEALEAEEVNERTNMELFRFLTKFK